MNKINELLLLYGSNLSKIKELVLSGADVNYTSPEGLTPLACAETVDVAAFLINRGADINAVNEDGKTPLFFMRSLDVCRFVLQNGADARHVNSKGETALFHTSDIEKIKLLIEAGCSPLVKNTSGERHYDLISGRVKVEFVKYIKSFSKKEEPRTHTERTVLAV